MKLIPRSLAHEIHQGAYNLMRRNPSLTLGQAITKITPESYSAQHIKTPLDIYNIRDDESALDIFWNQWVE